MPTETGSRFVVAIAAEDGRQNLVEHEFEWPTNPGRRGVSFEVPMSTLTSAGGDRFVAKLYSAGDPKPVITRELSLEAPEE